MRYLERVHNNISWDKAKDCKTSIQLSIEKYFFQGCSYIVCSNEFLFSKTFPLCCGKFSIDHITIFNNRADQQPFKRSKPVNLWRFHKGVKNRPDLSPVTLSQLHWRKSAVSSSWNLISSRSFSKLVAGGHLKSIIVYLDFHECHIFFWLILADSKFILF